MSISQYRSQVERREKAVAGLEKKIATEADKLAKYEREANRAAEAGGKTKSQDHASHKAAGRREHHEARTNRYLLEPPRASHWLVFLSSA
jgi:hypothetical protein